MLNPAKVETTFEQKVVALKKAITAETTEETVKKWVAKLLESHPERAESIAEIFGSLIKKGDK
jgi:hypothetical protein